MIHFIIFVASIFVKRFFLLICFILFPFTGFAGVSYLAGKWSPEKYVPVFSVQEHYDRGYQALYENNWDEALKHFMVVIYHFITRILILLINSLTAISLAPEN